jgi:arylsulfatase A-like enzyme
VLITVEAAAKVGEEAEATTTITPPSLPTTPEEEDPPNILLIVSDDQPFYTANYTPAILNEIFAKGTTFSDAFLSTSLCCPSRASILTSLYAHNHTVTIDQRPLTNTTFFEAIKDNASLDDEYRTALVGKYLNSQSGDCRNEFDYWVAFPGSQRYGTSPWYNGTNQPLNINCKWMQFNNTYSTYLLRDYALQFLNDTIAEGKPFVMQFSPFNSHALVAMTEPLADPTPAPEDANLYPNGLPSYYLPPSFNEADVTDKPAWVQELPLGCQEEGRSVVSSECEEEYKKKQLSIARNLASLDRSVKALLDFLESKDELSNTLIIYINDNGILTGEHRTFSDIHWASKNMHYKESVKAIMGARWDDGPIPIGKTSHELVGNIDIAPTIYDVLGLTPPYPLDGQSLLDLWRADNSSEPWRESILLEHKGPRYRDATIVTKSWSYTETRGDKSELYDRENDPYELNNLWCSPVDPSCAYSWTITKLAAELHLLHPLWASALAQDALVQAQRDRAADIREAKGDRLDARADRLDARADRRDAGADRAEDRGNVERAAELRQLADESREHAAELRQLAD